MYPLNIKSVHVGRMSIHNSHRYTLFFFILYIFCFWHCSCLWITKLLQLEFQLMWNFTIQITNNMQWTAIAVTSPIQGFCPLYVEGTWQYGFIWFKLIPYFTFVVTLLQSMSVINHYPFCVIHCFVLLVFFIFGLILLFARELLL